jgi:hypothetical protein
MRRAILLIFSLNLFAISLNLKAQKSFNVSSALQTPAEYHLQVKQFGEFVDRFNYKTDWKGNFITDEFAQKVPRANYIFYLINADDERLTNPNDSTYRVLCSEFIAFIDEPSNPKTITLFSEQVKAFAMVNFLYFGKPQRAKVELLPEVLPDRSAKWVISSVETNCFAAIDDSLRTHFIAPNSHETNYINIKKINGQTNPIYYFSTALATNSTMLFMTEAAKNRIKIQTIEAVKYYISFSGWVITVEEFNRTTTNSGWLISNVEKVNLKM